MWSIVAENKRWTKIRRRGGTERRKEGRKKREAVSHDETLMQMSDQRYINNDYRGTKGPPNLSCLHLLLPLLVLCWFIVAGKTRSRILRCENLSKASGKKRGSSACFPKCLSRLGIRPNLYCFGYGGAANVPDGVAIDSQRCSKTIFDNFINIANVFRSRWFNLENYIAIDNFPYVDVDKINFLKR